MRPARCLWLLRNTGWDNQCYPLLVVAEVLTIVMHLDIQRRLAKVDERSE